MNDTGWAKVNLALHVRLRRADGYHELETLFAFVDAGDGVALQDGTGLSIDGPFGDGLAADDDNLILRAAKAWGRAETGFHLTKNLPIAAGLGGGSADAAAALRLFAARDGVALDDPRLFEIAAELGADVPACILSQTCRGDGVGDKLTPVEIEGLAGTPILLVNPRVACPTGAVFKGWDGVDHGPLGDDFRKGRNDLESPAIALIPEIAKVLKVLSDMPGANLVRMSGSGATCFALFDDRDAMEEAEARLNGYHPDWWTLGGQIR